MKIKLMLFGIIASLGSAKLRYTARWLRFHQARPTRSETVALNVSEGSSVNGQRNTAQLL